MIKYLAARFIDIKVMWGNGVSHQSEWILVTLTKVILVKQAAHDNLSDLSVLISCFHFKKLV